MLLAVRYTDGRDPWVNVMARFNLNGVVDHNGRPVTPRSGRASRAVQFPTADVKPFPRLVSPGLLNLQYAFLVSLRFLLEFLDATFRVEASDVKGPDFKPFIVPASSGVLSDVAI